MRAVRGGKKLCDVAAELKVDRTTVLRWCQRYEELGVVGLEQLGRSGRPREPQASSSKKLKSLLLRPASNRKGCEGLWTVSRLQAALAMEGKADKQSSSDKTDTLWRRLREVGIKHNKPSQNVRKAYTSACQSWLGITEKIRTTVKTHGAGLFVIREMHISVLDLAGDPGGGMDGCVTALFAISATRRLVFQFYADRPSTADIASFVERLYMLNKRRHLVVVLPSTAKNVPTIVKEAAKLLTKLHIFQVPKPTSVESYGKKARRTWLDPVVYNDCCFADLF